ncbi:MAG: redoxin domain-containing protein [Planctomycetaceae bacterium]
MRRLWQHGLYTGFLLAAAAGWTSCSTSANAQGPTAPTRPITTANSTAGGAPVQAPGAQQAIDPAGEEIQGIIERAATLYDANERVKAIAVLEQGLAKYPNDPDLVTFHAEWLHLDAVEALEAKEIDKAMAIYAKVFATLQKFPKDVTPTLEEKQLFQEIYYNVATAFSEKGDKARCLAYLKQSIVFGFDDDAYLAEDKDMAILLGTPELDTILRGIQVTKVQNVLEAIDQFESFPFDFNTTDVNGRPMSLKDYRGKLLVVDIWATWCIPCRAEIPHFVDLMRKYGNTGFDVVGFNFENEEGPKDPEALATVRKFLADQKVPYRCSLISNEVRAQIPGDVQSLPTTLFIDQTGKVRLVLVGSHPKYILEAVTAKLMAK